jgi:hypothetical protein
MPRLSSPPRLPPLKPLERLVMGLTLLLLATPAGRPWPFPDQRLERQQLGCRRRHSGSRRDVVLAERLGSSKADRENVPPADR